MPSLPTRLRYSAASALLAAVALGMAGCGTRPKDDSFDEAVATGERPVAMKGDATFFGGLLKATVTVSRGVGRGSAEGKAKLRRSDFAASERMDADEAAAYMRARGALGSPLPPVTIRLMLENRAQQAFKIEILDVNSDLGNFAVDPSNLSLGPGATAGPNPMISQLGVTSDDIPMVVTLRIGSKTETKTIEVKNLSVLAPPPPGL